MYHYTTSRTALENILVTRRMWATDLRAMNDTRELRHGHELLAQRMKVMTRKVANDAKASFLRTTFELYRSLMAKHSIAFGISFSKRADLPHQWWDYASEGSGFALEWSIDDQCPEIPLRMWVTYDLARQKYLLDGLMTFHLDWIGDAVAQGARTPADAFSEAGLSLAKLVDVTVHTFKAAKWSPESEFRFVYRFFEGYVPGNVAIKTRPAGNSQKRYIEADFGQVQLGRVIVGPMNDYDQTARWLRLLLDSNGYTGTMIAPSVVTAAELLRFR